MEAQATDRNRTMTLVEDLILGNWHGDSQINIGTKTECLLPVCGHSCSLCKPIPQQLLQLTESHAKSEIVTEKAPSEEHLVSN